MAAAQGSNQNAANNEVAEVICGSMKIAPFHTLAKRFPEIAREWHPTKNKQLTPDQVTPFSGKKVWWQCRKEAEHEWETQVSSRTSVKAKCPFCSGRKVSSTNSLKARFPELAREWHPTKNEKLKPQHVTPTSDKKVWWLCKTNRQHEWRAAIGQRYRGSGCPYCVNRRVNGSNSLVLSFPELVKEWHPKNGKLIPENVSPGTAKRVWWHCTKDKSHEWESPVNSRTLKKVAVRFAPVKESVQPTLSKQCFQSSSSSGILRATAV